MNSNSDQKSPTPGQWSTGLFGCFEDCGNCFLTACAPSVTFGHTAELLDEGRTSYINAAISFRRGSSLSLYKYRTKLRALYSLPEEPCEDFCVYCWCMGCAICQEYRELKNRGFDPSKGWDQFNASKMEGATASKMEGATTKPPSAATGMAR